MVWSNLNQQAYENIRRIAGILTCRDRAISCARCSMMEGRRREGILILSRGTGAEEHLCSKFHSYKSVRAPGVISKSLCLKRESCWSGWSGQHSPFGAGGEEFRGLAHACFALSLLARRVFLWLLMSRGRRGGWWRTGAGTRVLIRHATNLHREEAEQYSDSRYSCQTQS